MISGVLMYNYRSACEIASWLGGVTIGTGGSMDWSCLKLADRNSSYVAHDCC